MVKKNQKLTFVCDDHESWICAHVLAKKGLHHNGESIKVCGMEKQKVLDQVTVLIPREKMNLEGIRMGRKDDMIFGSAKARRPESLVIEEWDQIQAAIDSANTNILVIFVQENNLLAAVKTTIFRSEEPEEKERFDKVVVIVRNIPAVQTKISWEQEEAENLLELSSLNYSIIQIHQLIVSDQKTPSPVVSKGGIRLQQEFSAQKISHVDLAFVILECACPGSQDLPRRCDQVRRLCRIPRYRLVCHSVFSTLEKSDQRYAIESKFPRQVEKYSYSLLRSPPGRWGTLKFHENRSSDSTYLRRPQKQSLSAFESSNMMPKELKLANRFENSSF